jgi:hypothetical protein
MAALRHRLHEHAITNDARNRADKHTAVLGKTPFDERLVVAAAEEAIREAARVRQRHRQQVVRQLAFRGLTIAAPDQRVDPAAVAADRGGYVLRPFLTALDLEAVHGGHSSRSGTARAPARSFGLSR